MELDRKQAAGLLQQLINQALKAGLFQKIEDVAVIDTALKVLMSERAAQPD